MDAEKQAALLREVLEAGFAGGISLSALREELGIDRETWERWLRDGGTPGDMVRLSHAMAEMSAPWVWASLLALTKEGSIPAMKLYFELCKEKNPPLAQETDSDRDIQTLRQEIFGLTEGGEHD